MFELTIPALYALLVWWFGTGIVLYLARLPARTYTVSLAVSAALGIVAIAIIALTARSTTTASAYLAFTSAIVVWAFIELAFLTGAILGQDRSEALPGTAGWKRMSHAIAAIIHHELALVLAGAAIFAVSYGAPNRIAIWTFAILWLLRLSAKLNLFLGVPNLHDELLPERLSHLRSHFRRGPTNPLLPASIVLAVFAAGYCVHIAISAENSGLSVTGSMLMASLLALAALEHVFMLIPLPVMNLWNWRRSRDGSTHTTARTAIEPSSLCQGPKVRTSIARRGL
ncbi:MAG: putative photosynthetic complex assembly protein PuhE [Pseudomonadota bacterium]